MNDFNWTNVFLIFVVCLHATIAFKIPGLPSSGGGGGGNRPPMNAKGFAGKHRVMPKNEYLGEVFIIRELQDKGDRGERFDAFITSGAIQEAKPATAGPSETPLQPPHKTAGEQEEDEKYFGVLITQDTVKQLGFDDQIAVNVPLSVLLNASASRIPWLIVLRRDSYPHVLEQFESAPPPPPPSALRADAIPGMQIPQRRGYYSADRHRRDVRQHYPGAAERLFAARDPLQYDAVAEPLLFEHKLLSTMCYNFVRENADGESKLQVELTRSDGGKCGDDNLQLVQYETFNAKPYISAAVNRAQPTTPTLAQEFVV